MLCSGIIYPQGSYVSMGRDVTEQTRATQASDAAYLELEERYRQLAEQSPDAIAIHQGGRMVFINTAGVKLLGADRPEMVLGKSVFDFVHPDLLPLARERARQVVANRTPAGTVEERFVRLDGEMIDVQVTSMPITYGGKPAAQIMIRDITDRRQAEAQLRISERRYQRIFESAGVAIFEEDVSFVVAELDALAAAGVRDVRAYLEAHPDFVWRAVSLMRIIDVNQAAVEMFRARDKAHLLSSLAEILAPDSLPVLIEEFVALAEGRISFEAELALRTLEGNRIDVLLTMRLPAEPSQGDHTLVTLMDITDRKRAETAVAQALATAEDALRVRAEFLSVATHELRTPVTSLRAAAQFLNREFHRAGEQLPQQLARMADVVDRQTVKLARMVDQLLDFSRLEAGRLVLERQPTDLMAIVHGVAELGRTLSERHKVVVQGPKTLMLSIDPLRLEQALINLVSNAVKFSPAGGTVTVTVDDSRRDVVEIAVVDEGVGVPEGHRERIFERFYQVETSERSTGMGLGLYITREIVELHGGRIRQEPAVTGGSRFAFTLPRA